MSTSPGFLIEGILPAYEVHLLGGSSGSGKTTLVFQTLADWQDGLPVFGHQSNPVPYSYLSLDRSRSSVDRTLDRLGLRQRLTRILCQDQFKSATSLPSVIAAAQSIHKDSKFFVIEGFQTLVGDKGNSYSPVSNLLRATANICSERQITVLGVAHSPKMKTDESFQHARELILGSVAWGAYSDTIITVQLDETTGNITVRVSPRNAAAQSFHYVFGPSGVLVELLAGKPKESIILKIEALSSGSVLTRAEVVAWCDVYKVSSKTGDRAIVDCVKNKVLEPLEPGFYERTQRPPLKLAHDPDSNPS